MSLTYLFNILKLDLRYAVDSSQSGGQLVTSKHQSRTAAAVITLAHSFRSPPLLKKMHKKLSRKQSEQQSTHSVLLRVRSAF